MASSLTSLGSQERESKSIPKNIKLGQALKQLCFLNVIPLLSLGSADIATDLKAFTAFSVSLWILAFLTEWSREEKAYTQRVLRM